MSLFLLVFSLSCGKSSYFAPPAASPASSTLSCTSSVLDYGTKSTTYTRGSVTDTKLIPGTTYPAVTYADTGSLTLKFTFWDGSKYKTEIVAGDYSASAIRLIFTSAGIPWIFWISGASVKVAVRSAELSSSAAWNVLVLDSGSTPITLEASINPLNQIGLMYLTDQGVAGRPKFLYCTNCVDGYSFLSMGPTTYIEDSNVVASTTQIGMAWCKVSETVYYPAVTYSTGASVQYGICQKTSLSDCLSTSNWSLQSVVAASNIASRLYLDPTSVGDVPKVATGSGAGIVTYSMGSTACSATPAAFSVGATLGGATSGTKTLGIVKDETGRFHLVANEGAAGVKYYNSTGTDFVGTWNTAATLSSSTIDLPTWHGIDIDTSTGGIYASYGVSSGAYDVRVARISNYSVASSSSSLNVSSYQLDGTGNLQKSDTPKRHISMKSTSTGIPATAYVDYSGTESKLKYAIRSGTSASSLWRKCTLPEAINAQSPSLTFDSHDHPWIAYFDVTLTRFFVATTSSSECGGFWVTYEFPVTPSGAQAVYPAANDTTVSTYTNSTGEYILVSILDTNASSRGVYSARLNPSTGQWSTPYTIVSLGASAGGSIDSDSDANGNAVLVFHDLTLARARYSATIDGVRWSNPLSISGYNQGMGGHIRLRPSTGSPYITYFDRANNRVYSSTCNDTPLNCVTGSWTASVVDLTTGVSGLTSRYDLLLSASLVFTTGDIPYVVYPRGKGADGNLAATELGTTNTSIIGSGANGNATDNLAFNYAVAGWGVASSPNAAGYFTSVYLGPGDWLYTSSCGD